MTVAILGAGIIGLCTANALRRKGISVRLFDPLPPGSCATYGNGGMVSASAVVPMALPGILSKIPSWLRDPEGPLFVEPKYLTKALPWLFRWAAAGSKKRAYTSSQALHQLHDGALREYRDMLGRDSFDSVIKVKGHIHLWDTWGQGKSQRISAELQDTCNIHVEELSPQQLRDMVPELTPSIGRALYFPDNGHTINPERLAKIIHRDFLQMGGQISSEKVLRIVPDGGSYRLWTNCGDHVFDRVVVASGAWSLALLKPLGLAFPLETERGYHIEIPDPQIELNYPVLHKGRGFGGAMMEGGLRLGGTVEIAGLEAPPNLQRIEAILKHARAIFPNLNLSGYKPWMGFRPSTPDSLPVLGESSRFPGLYIACGHGHLGITGGATSGRLMAEIIARTPTFIDPTPYRLERFYQ